MEYSQYDILKRIENLIASRKMTDVEFCKSIGASKTSVTDWRRRGQAPSALWYLPDNSHRPPSGCRDRRTRRRTMGWYRCHCHYLLSNSARRRR